MSYCKPQDMVERYTEQELIQLTDRENTGDIDFTVLESAINDASSEIDGYLAAYPLPLVIVPRVLTRFSCDIARYYLYDDHAPERVEKLYDNAIDFFKLVAKGTVSLGVDNAGQQPITADNAQMQSGGRVFGRNDNGFL